MQVMPLKGSAHLKTNVPDLGSAIKNNVFCNGGIFGMRNVIVVVGMVLSLSSFALNQSHEVQQMAISVVKVMAFRDVADKLQSTCPDLPMTEFKSREELNQAVLDRAGITADEFVERAALGSYIDTGRRQLERDIMKLLAGCDVSATGEVFDNFLWGFRSAYNELDLQMEFRQKIPQASESKPQKAVSAYEQLVSASKYIVIAKISPLNSVPKWYRDRYFAWGYHHNVVFQILEGWKEPKPLFVGIHSYLYDKNMVADRETRWLLYVNEANEILHAVPEREAGELLARLGPTKYFVSRNGDVVVRNMP